LKKINLYYDDECPFCKKYSKYIELRKKFDIKIINARDSINEIKNFRTKGFDINDGMIIELDDNIYQGADAAKVLDGCTLKDNFLDNFFSFFIRVPGFKGIIYPSILFIRMIILKISGKNPDIAY